MRLLLDTHIALWAITDSPKLGAIARALILDPANSIHVSAASVWEIAIKHQLGRGDMPVSAARAAQLFADSGYQILPITAAHAAATEALAAIHADPFDRLLVAQALSEPLQLLTRDRTVAAYAQNVQLV